MEYRVVSLNPSSLSVVSWKKKKKKKKNTSEKLFIFVYMYNVCGSFRYSYYMHKVQKMYFTVLLLLPQEKYSLQDGLHY